MLNRFIKVFKIITCISTFFCYHLDAQNYDALYYQVERFSIEAHTLMNDNSDGNIYHVYLDNVLYFLPYEIKIQEKKVIAVNKTFARKILKATHKKMLSRLTTEKEDKPCIFFSSFKENTLYNYVILDNSIIFTETAKKNDNYYKSKFSKHYFISGLRKKVHYAGQMRILKNKDLQKTTVIINNASGTYRPYDVFLPNVLDLLRDNFGRDKALVFLARPYNKIFRESYSEDESSTESVGIN